MTRGSERQRFAMQFYRFLQVLQLPCLLETRQQASCEVVERVGAIRMTRGSERQRFAIEFYRFLQVLALPCLLETRMQGICEVVQIQGAI